MDAVVAEFHRLNPDTHVTVDYSDTGDLQQELPGALRAGDGPDVFTVWPGSGNPASVTALEHDNLLENLSLRRFNRTMPIGVKPVTDVNGGTFAAERASVFEGRKHYFLIEFPQEPGALRRCLDDALGPAMTSRSSSTASGTTGRRAPRLSASNSGRLRVSRP